MFFSVVTVNHYTKRAYCNKAQWCDPCLLTFYLLRAQRLCCSQMDIERLTPQFAVTPLGSQCRRCGDPCGRRGGRRVGHSRWDNTCLHRGGGGGGRRVSCSLRLTVITKSDGALHRQRLFSVFSQNAKRYDKLKTLPTEIWLKKQVNGSIILPSYSFYCHSQLGLIQFLLLDHYYRVNYNPAINA